MKLLQPLSVIRNMEISIFTQKKILTVSWYFLQTHDSYIISGLTSVLFCDYLISLMYFSLHGRIIMIKINISSQCIQRNDTAFPLIKQKRCTNIIKYILSHCFQQITGVSGKLYFFNPVPRKK